MTFSDAIDNAAAIWFGSDFGDPITYNGKPIYGHVDYGKGGDDADASRATIEVAVSDVPDPQYLDPVIIEGVEWTVYRDGRTGDEITGDGVSWTIPLTRDERPGILR